MAVDIKVKTQVMEVHVRQDFRQRSEGNSLTRSNCEALVEFPIVHLRQRSNQRAKIAGLRFHDGVQVGSALHMHKTEQKGAAQHAKGEAQYSQEEGKGAAVGAKDKMVGAGKEVAGGLLGKEHLKNEGEAQQHAGTKRQEANQ